MEKIRFLENVGAIRILFYLNRVYKDTVCTIAENIGISPATARKRLTELESAGLISSFQPIYLKWYSLTKRGQKVVRVLLEEVKG